MRVLASSLFPDEGLLTLGREMAGKIPLQHKAGAIPQVAAEITLQEAPIEPIVRNLRNRFSPFEKRVV